MAELRSFIFLSRLQPQTMCYLGTWIRGSLPRSHVAAQVIEVAPGLDIEPLTDVAVKHADVRAGILVVERQFGYLEIHGGTDEVQAAASAVLGALGATARDATRPEVLASKIITMLDPQQARPPPPSTSMLDQVAAAIATADSARFENDPARYRKLALAALKPLAMPVFDDSRSTIGVSCEIRTYRPAR